MAKLYFYYASMNAGKSTTLLQADFNYRERGMRTLLFTAGVHDRGGRGVIDSRLGISAADKVRLFEEFDRSSNPAAHAESGSGLGLAIVHRIAERHGAQLVVDSEVGVGSTFRVLLRSC